MPQTVKTLLRLPPEVHAALVRAAEAEMRSQNKEIIHILTQYLTAHGYLPDPPKGR